MSEGDTEKQTEIQRYTERECDRERERVRVLASERERERERVGWVKINVTAISLRMGITNVVDAAR